MSDVGEGVGDYRELTPVEEVPKGDATLRLALMDCDWDHMSATDILALCRGACDRPNAVLKVCIYLSQFGRERLDKESATGPALPPQLSMYDDEDESERSVDDDEEEDEDDGEDDGEEEGEEESENEEDEEDEDTGSESGNEEPADIREEKMELAMRRMERERLRYYYAVVQMTDVTSASQLYDAIDGLEYQQSGIVVDARFVPEDQELPAESDAKEVASKVPVNYEAPEFTFAALQSSRTQSTWDGPDPKRQLLMKRITSAVQDGNDGGMGASDDDDDALLQLLAPGSSEEEEEAPKAVKATSSKKRQQRQLLLGEMHDDDAEEEEDSDDHRSRKHQDRKRERKDSKKDRKKDKKDRKSRKEEGVEISFRPGLESLVAENVASVLAHSESSGVKQSDWEMYQERSKEKRRAKRKERQAEAKEERTQQKQVLAQEMRTVREERREERRRAKAEQKGERKRSKLKSTADLTLMDEHDRVKRQKVAEADRVDMADDRFSSALLSNSNFALDRFHPSFKKSAVQTALQIAETRAQQQGAVASQTKSTTQATAAAAAASANDDISSLVQKIKKQSKSNRS
jgi:hypothetical protein